MLKEQEFLYAKVLKKVVLKYPKYSLEQIVDATVRGLYEGFISKQDRQLIQICFRKNFNQKNLDKFLNDWDIEAAGSKEAVIVACFMKMHPELKFDTYTGPRLKGLINYLRFQNLELISHFSRIVRRLNQNGITPMVIKGGAMRYLRPDLPRVMGDIDILLRSDKELNTAKQVVKNLNYAFTDAPHSFDVHPKDDLEKGILDIHRFFSFLPKLNEQINNELFNRAQKQKVFSVYAYVPATEDLAFICLNNLTLNLKHSASIQGVPHSIFDLVYLVSSKKNFDWDILIKDILHTHTEATSYLAMRFVNHVVPGLFPKKLFLNEKICKSLKSFIDHDKFYALYVHDVKFACKKLKLFRSMRSWSTFKNYLKLEGQHFFTKRILKHPLLIRLFLKYFNG